MFNGHFNEYSVERLMKFFTIFARDVEIVVRPAKPRSKEGKDQVYTGSSLNA